MAYKIRVLINECPKCLTPLDVKTHTKAKLNPRESFHCADTTEWGFNPVYDQVEVKVSTCKKCGYSREEEL